MLRARATALRAQGRFVEFVFIFAGHGGIDRGNAYLALEDGRLGQQDLESLVIDGVPADVTHVIIDACSAASFVESRGAMRGDRRALPNNLMPFGRLVERHPRVGFVVAASADGNAFEWSRFGSGVASHLIRSALSGAADMSPPDGRVTYDELNAFVKTATSGLLSAEYRQDITVIPPRALPSAALLELRSEPTATELLLDRPGRYYVRDADGHRIMDVHTGNSTARLLLPPYSPRFELVEMIEQGSGCTGPGRIRARDCTLEERSTEFDSGGTRRASKLNPSASTVAARGAIEDSAFEALMQQPYDAGTFARDTVAPSLPDEAVPDDLTRPSLGLGYRGTISTLLKELGPVHGIELRLELPVRSWLVVAPVAGVGRGTATPAGAAEYPVYQFDL